MSENYPVSKDSKCCAVCNYWNGPRGVDVHGRATIRSLCEDGQCIRQIATNYVFNSVASHTCPNCEAWPVLR